MVIESHVKRPVSRGYESFVASWSNNVTIDKWPNYLNWLDKGRIKDAKPFIILRDKQKDVDVATKDWLLQKSNASELRSEAHFFMLRYLKFCEKNMRSIFTFLDRESTLLYAHATT